MMRKRLRKKKRVGEFGESGFPVAFRLRETLDSEDVDAFVDDLIHVVEDHDLAFGGGGKLEWRGYVMRLGRGSTFDTDRQVIAAFLAGDARVQASAVGELTDAWYGDWDEDLPLASSRGQAVV